jgi:MFS family permease
MLWVMADPATTAAPRGRYRDALGVPEFRALFAAYSLSLTGSVVSAVALMVLVYERTGSSLLASLTFALGFLPYLVSGALLSAVVDRIPLRRLLVACDLVCAALVGAMAIPAMPVPVLLVLLLAVGTASSLSGGGRGALLPAIVTEAAYIPARSLFRIAAQSAQIVGNATGGALLIVLTPRGAILIDAASFLVSAALMRVGVRHRDRMLDPAERPALLRDSLQGLGAVLRCLPLRRLLLLGWLVPTFSVAPEALAAPYVDGLGGRAALVGFWLVAIPLGVVIGDLTGIWALSPQAQQRLVGPLAAVTFVPLLAFAADPGFALAWPLLVLSGLGAAYSLGFDALFRRAAPAPLFGRAMAINSAGLMTLQGLGFAAAGALAEVVAPHVAIAIAGVAGLTVVALLRPRRAEVAGPVTSEPIESVG